jgi:protein-tyrosine phosphatase
LAIGILFVCTGNTCRSPMAVGVMRSLVHRAGLTHAFEVDSAGTGVRQAGQPPNRHALEAAARRGHDIASLRSRPLTTSDIGRFSHPLAMERAHLAAMRALAPSVLAARPRLFAAEDIADPWGGGIRDYERALDLIEAGCVDLLAHLGVTLEQS